MLFKKTAIIAMSLGCAILSCTKKSDSTQTPATPDPVVSQTPQVYTQEDFNLGLLSYVVYSSPQNSAVTKSLNKAQSQDTEIFCAVSAFPSGEVDYEYYVLYPGDDTPQIVTKTPITCEKNGIKRFLDVASKKVFSDESLTSEVTGVFDTISTVTLKDKPLFSKQAKFISDDKNKKLANAASFGSKTALKRIEEAKGAFVSKLGDSLFAWGAKVPLAADRSSLLDSSLQSVVRAGNYLNFELKWVPLTNELIKQYINELSKPGMLFKIDDTEFTIRSTSILEINLDTSKQEMEIKSGSNISVVLTYSDKTVQKSQTSREVLTTHGPIQLNKVFSNVNKTLTSIQSSSPILLPQGTQIQIPVPVTIDSLKNLLILDETSNEFPNGYAALNSKGQLVGWGANSQYNMGITDVAQLFSIFNDNSFGLVKNNNKLYLSNIAYNDSLQVNNELIYQFSESVQFNEDKIYRLQSNFVILNNSVNFYKFDLGSFVKNSIPLSACAAAGLTRENVKILDTISDDNKVYLIKDNGEIFLFINSDNNCSLVPKDNTSELSFFLNKVTLANWTNIFNKPIVNILSENEIGRVYYYTQNNEVKAFYYNAEDPTNYKILPKNPDSENSPFFPLPQDLQIKEGTEIIYNDGAFAVIQQDNTIAVWGDIAKGGYLPVELRNIKVEKIVAGPDGFFAVPKK